MELFAIKNQDANKALHQGASTPALPTTTDAFAALLQKAGARFEGDMAALIGRTTQTDAPEQAKAPAKADDRDYARRETPGDDRRPEGSRGDDRADSRPEAARGDRNSDAGRDATNDAGRDRSKTNSGEGREDRTGQAQSARDTEQAGPTDNANKSATEKDAGASAADAGTQEDQQTASGETGTSTADAQPSEAIAAVQPAANAQQQAATVLGGLLQVALASAAPQADSEESIGQQRAGPGENAVRGLTTALDAVTAPKAAPGDAGLDGQTRQNGAHAKAAAVPQAAANPEAQARSQVDTSAHANSGAAQQAAGLARLIGPANKLSVEVTVTDDAATLVSRPAASLAASVVAATENGNQSRGGPQSNPNNAHGTATPFAAQVAAQANGPESARAQQSTFTAMQEQALASSTSQAKAPVSAAANATTSQPHALGGDAAPSNGSGSAAESQPVRATAPQQAANAPRPAPAGQALVDQVSVQITKALQSGIDRISIQLRPESMGRVDVHLEMAHDGRVTALVIADNKDTLETLQRDARNLQQALLDAGLQAGADDLSFNLRGENSQADGGDGAGSTGRGEPTAAADAEGENLQALLGGYGSDIVSDTRIDIRV